MEKIRILQLGSEDWNGVYTLPEDAELHYEENLQQNPSKPYDLVFLDRTPRKEEIPFLYQAAKAYTLFATDHVAQNEETDWLLCSRKGVKSSEGTEEPERDMVVMGETVKKPKSFTKTKGNRTAETAMVQRL